MKKLLLWRIRRAYYIRDSRGTRQITLQDISQLIRDGIDFDFKDRSRVRKKQLHDVLLDIIKDNTNTSADIYLDCIKNKKSIINIIRRLEHERTRN